MREVHVDVQLPLELGVAAGVMRGIAHIWPDATLLGNNDGVARFVVDADSIEDPVDDFEGTVEDAGGGMVTILVDRDTLDYPKAGSRVQVIPVEG